MRSQTPGGDRLFSVNHVFADGLGPVIPPAPPPLAISEGGESPQVHLQTSRGPALQVGLFEVTASFLYLSSFLPGTSTTLVSTLD